MEKFKTLIDEVKAQSNKNKKFLVAHGIDPKALLIPMYYPGKNCNVILQSPSDDSPWFKDEKISPKDKVLVRCVSEVYDKEGNFYKKEKGDIIELTVDEYKNEVFDLITNYLIDQHLLNVNVCGSVDESVIYNEIVRQFNNPEYVMCENLETEHKYSSLFPRLKPYYNYSE